MRTPAKKQNGLIAILDALGAANYGDTDIGLFLESRQNVLELLKSKIVGMPSRVSSKDIEVFTFNDTVLIAFTTADRPTLENIDVFFTILRKFFVDSLSNKILFRGSVAVGTFYLDGKSNTVMGQAVTDAAAWYDKAEWLGIQTTPRATIVIQRWLEQKTKTKAHLMLDYDVPLKNGQRIRVKTVNWPKVFFVKDITPCAPGQKPREKFLELLAEHSVPFGTEIKYQNAIAFFDHAANEIERQK